MFTIFCEFFFWGFSRGEYGVGGWLGARKASEELLMGGWMTDDGIAVYLPARWDGNIIYTCGVLDIALLLGDERAGGGLRITRKLPRIMN